MLAATGEQAALARASDYTKGFRKDCDRLSRSGRYDMQRLKEVMGLLIANDVPLGPEGKDHQRNGCLAPFTRVSHRRGFSLICEIEDSARTGTVLFVRASAHADLFEQGLIDS